MDSDDIATKAMTEDLEIFETKKANQKDKVLLETDQDLNELNFNLVKGSKAFKNKSKILKKSCKKSSSSADVDYVLQKT